MAFKFFKNRKELLSGTQHDCLTNEDISDIIAFTEALNTLEKGGKITFTVNMDSQLELADLFRLCMAQFVQEKPECLFAYYAEQFLLNMEKKSKAPITITEVCPNCGHEITMEVPQGTEKINFCPYCGDEDVYLCSECIEEIGSCQPSASCAYCHGHAHNLKI